MVVLAELRVVPIGTSSTSLSTYVAEALKVLEELNVRYTLTPFGTCIEVSDFSELASILDRISKRLSSLGVRRMVIDVAMDVRYDKQISLESKVRSVEEKIKTSQSSMKI
ncbi:MAG: MTH1187 family thiamine-binding protein [Ignisphaera sp.]|nr:MTH1187 family thiamine-binding protein [Ignisphaera sp.]MDW8085970.1 MTH1187 family thiamine-binding protein [Ignisphaera sp.]